MTIKPTTDSPEDEAMLREALEPFARIAPFVEYTDFRDGEVVHRQHDRDGSRVELTKDDFRRAAKAYAASPQPTASPVGGVEKMARTICEATGGYWWQIDSMKNKDNQKWIKAAYAILALPAASPVGGVDREAISRILKETLVASTDVNGMPLISGINSATTAILALPAGGGWQPIKTAPKDGTPVDLLSDSGRRWPNYRWDKDFPYGAWSDASYRGRHWRDRPFMYASQVTHWLMIPALPLPEPAAMEVDTRPNGETL